MVENLLSITNLLNSLQVDRNSDAVKLCIEADRLRRRQQPIKAIEVAESATQLAHNNYPELGITLLYLSCMRLASRVPNIEAQGVRDCERAIRSLGSSPVNQVLARLIRAQIEDERENTSRQSTLVCYQKAKRALQEIRYEAWRFNRTRDLEIYESILASVDDKIADLSSDLADVPDDEYADTVNSSDQAMQPPPTQQARSVTDLLEHAVPPPIQLSVPTRIVWPLPEPAAGFQILSLSERTVPDYFETNHLSIDNQLYRIEPTVPLVDRDGFARLRTKQPYLIVPFLNSECGQYALVRRATHPEQSRQFVIVHDPTSQTAWIDDAESKEGRIRIIGARREWVIQDDVQPPPVFLNEPWIVGVVEAVLTRVS